jgi:hypothetical protein
MLCECFMRHPKYNKAARKSSERGRQETLLLREHSSRPALYQELPPMVISVPVMRRHRSSNSPQTQPGGKHELISHFFGRQTGYRGGRDGRSQVASSKESELHLSSKFSPRSGSTFQRCSMIHVCPSGNQGFNLRKQLL